MSTVSVPPSRVAAADVHTILGSHMLVDGFPLVLDLERSHDCWLYDSRSGQELLDFYTCFSTLPLGFNHPELTREDSREELAWAAVHKPSNSDFYTAEMAAFVAVFAQTLPESLRHHLFFIEGGGLAVENAMKAAFDWKVRKNLAAGRGELGSKILHFKEAFHGRTGYTLSVTNTDPVKIRYFPKFDWPRVSNPKLRFPVNEQVLSEVQDLEQRTVHEIEQAFAQNPHDIAALLIEPIQCEGGDNHFRGEFLRRLRALADAHDALLIFDEVQTGFGTTARWWCCEHFDVLPDILAFGKKTQVCGIAASRRLDEVESVFHVASRINSTWGGGLVDMVRCRRIVETIRAENLLRRAQVSGDLLLQGLGRLEQRFAGKVTNARGRGLLLAFDLPDGETRKRALAALRDQKLLALACGPRSLRFRPALVLTSELAKEGLRRIERGLSAVLS